MSGCERQQAHQRERQRRRRQRARRGEAVYAVPVPDELVVSALLASGTLSDEQSRNPKKVGEAIGKLAVAWAKDWAEV